MLRANMLKVFAYGKRLKPFLLFAYNARSLVQSGVLDQAQLYSQMLDPGFQYHQHFWRQSREQLLRN
jgi:hypothetical protein